MRKSLKEVRGMMLKRIKIDKLYGYKNFDIDFQQQSCLLGINGTGKSSILRIIDAFFTKKIDFLKKLDYDSISFFFQNEKEKFDVTIKKKENKELIQKDNKNIDEEKFSCVVFDSRMNQYMENSYKNRIIELKEEIKELDIENEKKELEEELLSYEKNLKSVFQSRFRMNLSKSYYEKFMNHMNFWSYGIQYIDDRKKYLESIVNKNISFAEGENSFDFLEKILNPIKIVTGIWEKLTKEYLNNLIKGIQDDTLSQYLKGINSFFYQTGKEVYLDEENTDIQIRSLEKKTKIEVENLSSGETELLIVYTQLFFHSKIDTMILLDEPERSLHIEWQVSLGEFMGKILQNKGNTSSQLIIATHSPFILQNMNEKGIVDLNEKQGDRNEHDIS